MLGPGRQPSVQQGLTRNISMEPLRVRSFGGLMLLVGGEPTTGTLTQRRRLALLALLAVARDRGLSRDKILAYLWRESDAERARHGLDQVLYAQRHHLGVPDLFLGRKTLRLNRTVITADVWEFEDALENGMPEVAVRCYTGPFLDGFFVKGAPGFERWAEDERDRLARGCATALGSLASAASAGGDHRRAAEWWRRAADVNPFDTETAVRLVETWVAAGERAAALPWSVQHVGRVGSDPAPGPDARGAPPS